MDVRVFGATAVTRDDESSPRVLSCGVKPRQILAILATRLGEPISKERLAALLWDTEPPRSYVASLESYVCVLRRELGVTSGRTGALATTSRGYLLDPELVRVDLGTFRSLVDRAESASDAAAVELVRQALSVARGPLLASDPYSPWAEEERTVFHRQLLRACVRGALAARRTSAPAEALRFAERALELDALAEPAWVERMRSLTALGRRAEALQTYAELRRVLADQLGVEPGSEARTLYLDLLCAETNPVALERSGPDEIRLLLGLLRQAIESMPGTVVPASDRDLATMAVDLAGAA